MAFQSELYDVKVEFSLQKRLKGTGELWESTGEHKNPGKLYCRKTDTEFYKRNA